MGRVGPNCINKNLSKFTSNIQNKICFVHIQSSTSTRINLTSVSTYEHAGAQAVYK